MSSLIYILKNFIQNIENDINDPDQEKSNICKLNYILDEYYQNNYESDDSDIDSDIDSEYTQNSNITPDKPIENIIPFNELNNVQENLTMIGPKIDRINNTIELPELSYLKTCSIENIVRWILLDKEEDIQYQMILNACKQNYDDEYIIYLIKLGFTPSIYDTLYIAEYEKYDLLKYYCENKLPFNKFTLTEVIRQGRLDIFDWLFINNMIEREYYQYIIDTAIMFNDIFIIDYLKRYHNIVPNSDIYYILRREFMENKINNVMISWLWGNGVKWTLKQANEFNNSFMLSFFQ